MPELPETPHSPIQRSSGVLAANNPPAPKPAAQEPSGEPAAEPTTYDKIFSAAQKMVEPKAPPPAVTHAAATPPAPSQALIARGRDLGMDESEIAKVGEDGVAAAERALLRALRKHQSNPPAVPAQAPPPAAPAPSLWQSEEEKKKYDPDFVALAERMNATLAKQNEVIETQKKQIEQLTGFVQSQVAEQGRSTIDRITDKLAEEGYTEFGTGKSRPGTPQYAAKAELATLLGAEFEAYQKLGKDLDLEAAARVHAERLFGKKETAQETPKRTPPPKDPETGRFTKPTQFTLPGRTPTNRPTNREGPPPEKGRDAAVQAARGWFAQNGSPLLDIHGEE